MDDDIATRYTRQDSHLRMSLIALGSLAPRDPAEVGDIEGRVTHISLPDALEQVAVPQRLSCE